jgi:copper(I)-binding protein
MITLQIFRRPAAAVALAFGLTAAVVHATGLFIVNQPWARPAQAGQATEVYMDLTSTEGATVVAVASDAAVVTRIRAPDKQPDRAERIALPAGALVALAPGRYRIALLRLTRTLKLGDRVKLALTVEATDGSRQEIGVDAEVRLRSPSDDELRAHQHPTH